MIVDGALEWPLAGRWSAGGSIRRRPVGSRARTAPPAGRAWAIARICTCGRGWKQPATAWANVANRDRFFRTHIIRPARLPPQQDGPQPDGHIGGVEIRAERRAVAAHDDRPAPQAVANKIADGKMDVQRQLRARRKRTPARSSPRCHTGRRRGRTGVRPSASLGHRPSGDPSRPARRR